jgi:hypothetical protein
MTSPTIGRYLLGVAALLIVFGSLGFAALRIRRRYLPDWGGAPARLAEAVLGLGLLTAILEALGALGLFSLAPIAVAALLIGIATAQAIGDTRAAHACAARVSAVRIPKRLEPTATTLTAAAATTAVLAEWTAITLQSYRFGIRTFDSIWYHLPWAAGFAQTGQITPLRFTDIEYLTPFYPATAELFHGLGIVLFARDTISPGLNLVWLGLVLLAGYCVGRPRGVGALTLTAAALAMALPAIDISQAGSAANDIVGVFFVLAAVALLLNAGDRRFPGDRRLPGDRRFPFALAAVSAGLAIGVKLTMVAPVLALTVGAIVVSPRGRRRAASVLWLVPLLVAGGFWYLRNLIAVGNPLPWLNLPALATPAPALQQHTGFSVAHYLAHGHGWNHYFEPGLASGLGPWWYVILALVIAGPVLCVLPGADRTLRMLGLVALMSLGAYLVTPETAAGPDGQPLGFAFNLRYAAPVLALALPLLPLAPALDGARRRAAVAGALILVLVATLAQGRLWPSRQLAGEIGIAAAVLALGIAAAVLARAPRRPLQAAALAGVAVVVIAAYPWQRHYLHGRYAFQPGVSYLAKVWAFFRHVHHARVGVAGTFGGFFSYPLFGIDDSNHVEYIGSRGPHGSFTAIDSCSQWRAAVNAGHFRYLVTTPARDPWHPKPLRPSPEGAWTASDPAARVVYRRRATGQTIAIYELQGPLNPAACPR